MAWLKNAVVDLVVTLFIVLSVVFTWPWAVWIIGGYTLLMLVVKLVALLASSRLPKMDTSAEPPAWFFHVLYAVNVAALLWGGLPILAAGWAAIWVVSFVAMRRRPVA